VLDSGLTSRRSEVEPDSSHRGAVTTALPRSSRARGTPLLPRPGVPPFVFLAVLAGVYFLAGKLGLALAFVHANATAVWPPTGIALAAALLFGHRVWPAILTGAFLVNATTAGSLATSLGIASGNTLEAVVGAWLVNRFAGGIAAFQRPAGVFRFAILAAGVSTMVSATIGVLTLWSGGYAEMAGIAEIWFTWWLGDAVGALVVAPFIVLWVRPVERRRLRGGLEAVGLAIALAVTGWAVFAHRAPNAFLCLPPLIWAAFRFGRRGAVTAAVLLSGLALWGTLQGYGPFASESSHESLLFLQAFLGMITLTALVLAAAVREHERTQEDLRRARSDLEVTVRDRTASLVEALEHLEKSRAVLNQAQRVAHVGSWQWDIGADRVSWSDELFRIYGLEPGSVEMTYGKYLERVHPEDRAVTDSTIRAVLDSGGVFDFEERIVRPDGHVRILHSRGYVEKDATGRSTRMIGTSHDITERKEAERELARRMEDLARSNADLSIFAHAASHDLKEPLRTVASNVQLIERRIREVDDPGVRRSVAFVLEGIRRMEEMIGDLLDYSRASHPSTTEADASEAVAEAMDRLQLAIDESGARIESVPLPRVAADLGRLVQLFQNLLSNAIKYRDMERALKIRIGAEKQGGMWRFEVADNGRGFPPEEAQRIFAVFERLDRDDGVAGTGLGLAICRRIVEAQGGRIWADSELGRGSVFRFTLPRAS
jgi:PAS domain S-box-containing protein